MLKIRPTILLTVLVLSMTALLVPVDRANAQCTVGEILDRMARNLAKTESAETGAVPPGTADVTPETPETPESEEAAVSESAPVSNETSSASQTSRHKRIIRRVGRACSWKSDVSKCTFRRVAQMALGGINASDIYFQCSD